MTARDLPLLSSRAAIRCARRTHNDHDPSLDDSQWVEVESSRWIELGKSFEVEVRHYLRTVLGSHNTDDVRATLAVRQKLSGLSQ